MPSISNEVNGGLTYETNGELKLNAKHGAEGEVLKQLQDELNRDLHCEMKQGLQETTNGTCKPAPPHSRPPPSIFTPMLHPNVNESSRDVENYYLQHWDFPSEDAKKKFVAAGFSRVTCLYFPKALDDRIQFACSLLTILFLIDDQLESMSLADGAAYNESLMPLCRGTTHPDRSVSVQWMMYDLWEDMRACDKVLADSVLEPVFLFMRAQTSKERLSIQGIGRYLQYRQADVGQALLAALMRFSMNLHLTPADFDSVTADRKSVV